MKILAIKIEDKVINNINKEELLNWISKERLIKIKKYLQKSDAIKSAIGELLIKFYLYKYKGIDINKDIEFAYNTYGKPYLKDYPNISYNVSHSGEWVICGIDQGMIGVDIEKIEEIRIDEVIKFFSEEERIYLSLLNGRQRLLRFYDLWTLKESYLKAVGKGISHSLDRFNVEFNSGIPYVTSPSNSFQIQKYNLRQIHVDPEYCLAICAKNNQFPKSITLITLNEILEHFKPYNRIP